MRFVTVVTPSFNITTGFAKNHLFANISLSPYHKPSCAIVCFVQSFVVLLTDVDECKYTERVCDHKCANLNGSYLCYCDFGYLDATDGRSCLGTTKTNKPVGLYSTFKICFVCR